jgi:nucleoside-diphosphate-sugar epimerase
MIIGSGLIAKAFAPYFAASPSIWIHAAGVSNSGCSDPREFERDRLRLVDALQAGANADAFVYFSTCSIMDPNASNSAYVRHKIEMERLVSEHPNFIVVRLPQVAGKTPNPHTLLNYLYAKVARSERFVIWKNATRNIIDIDDVACIIARLLKDNKSRRITINVASPVSYPIASIVAVMEKAVGKRALTEEVDDGAAYEIDTSQIRPIIDELGLSFDSIYLTRVIEKYYGK